jgi:hypothetical protein
MHRDRAFINRLLARVAMHQGAQNDAGFAKVTKILGNDGVCEVAAILGFYCTCGFVLGFFEVPPRT